MMRRGAAAKPACSIYKTKMLASIALAPAADEAVDQNAERNEHQQCADRQADQNANGIFDDKRSRIAVDAVESPQRVWKSFDIRLRQLQDVLPGMVGGLPG